MYVRINTYGAKVDKLDEASEQVRGMLPEIRGTPGLKHYYSAGRTDDGKRAVIAMKAKQWPKPPHPRLASYLAGAPIPKLDPLRG